MKQKIFVAQMLDSQRPNRQAYTQILDSVFFSNDTDAYVRFIPHEESFEFSSADIVFRNRDDESLVVRPATVEQYEERQSAVYEMPRDLLSHWGRWEAQAVFKLGTEVYSSVIVQFDVRRYLMDERPPSLQEYESVSEFMERNQGVINTLITNANDALTTVTTTNQSAQQAEAQRVSAESGRVSAEEQREIDHANRSAELAGKANKVVLENLIANGDFSDGVRNIQLSPGARIENQKLIYAHGTSGSTIRWFTKRLNTDMYYFYMKYNTDETSNAYQLSNNQGDIYSINSSSTFHSHRRTYHASANLSIYGGKNATHDLVVDYYIVLNLTEIFGAGKEPTKEEMDELIKVTGYIGGEYALNNKEMLIWTLALIRRNKNAIVALGGA